jgi:hypothetical protein
MKTQERNQLLLALERRFDQHYGSIRSPLVRGPSPSTASTPAIDASVHHLL